MGFVDKYPGICLGVMSFFFKLAIIQAELPCELGFFFLSFDLTIGVISMVYEVLKCKVVLMVKNIW